MTSTVPPVAAALGRRLRGASASAAGPPAGSVMVKVEPLPGSLSTATSPPSMRQKCRVMARPSPVPP